MAGRKRSESSKKAILEAALNILKTQGYAAVSIEAIAREANVGKQTIYRWWSSKGAVVLEALTEDASETIEEFQSEDFAKNLRAFLSATFNRLSNPAENGNAVRWLMAQAQIDSDFKETFRQEFIQARRAALLRVLRLGTTQKGKSTEKEEFLMDLIFGAMWYRLLIEHNRLDDMFAKKLTDLVIREIE